MTGKWPGIVVAVVLAPWIPPAGAKSGGISYAKNRYAQIHEQKTAVGEKPSDSKAKVGVVLSKADTKTP
jgi:hypothetical protein